MADELRFSFDELVDYRQQLGRFCRLHYDSLIGFNDGVSFKLDADDENLGNKARHLSSSATCIESLLDCPDVLAPGTGSRVLKLAENFSLAALARPHKEWLS